MAAEEDALLCRRGKRMNAELKDQERIYDPDKEADWSRRYRFFSGPHMKSTFRVYARARHDPFNKDPSWGQAMIARVGEECAKQGINPKDLFDRIDVTGDGTLNRPELKRALVQVMPALSDMELTAIFDVIDQDHSGEVGAMEFVEAVRGARARPVPATAVERWRNPIHRITRYAPARIEGWDHLDTKKEPHARLDQYCKGQADALLGRLKDSLTTPTALRSKSDEFKYERFMGGGDTARFHRQNWNTARRSAGSGSRPSTSPAAVRPFDAVVTEFQDPGGFDLRPGFLCDPKGRTCSSARGFSALTPRTRAARGTSGAMTAR